MANTFYFQAGSMHRLGHHPTIQFFLNGNPNGAFVGFNEFGEFRKSARSMKKKIGINLTILYYLCLPGAEVACRSFTHKIAGSNTKHVLQIP